MIWREYNLNLMNWSQAVIELLKEMVLSLMAVWLFALKMRVQLSPLTC